MCGMAVGYQLLDCARIVDEGISLKFESSCITMSAEESTPDHHGLGGMRFSISDIRASANALVCRGQSESECLRDSLSGTTEVPLETRS